MSLIDQGIEELPYTRFLNSTSIIRAKTRDGALVECFNVLPSDMRELVTKIAAQSLAEFQANADKRMYKIISRPVDSDALSPKDIDPLAAQVGGDHYRKLKIQPIEYIHANNIPFPEGCVIKYVTRWRAKNGIADLEKAKHFIELLIELEKKEESMKPK